jgi:hypothetical protein
MVNALTKTEYPNKPHSKCDEYAKIPMFINSVIRYRRISEDLLFFAFLRKTGRNFSSRLKFKAILWQIST